MTDRVDFATTEDPEVPERRADRDALYQARIRLGAARQPIGAYAHPTPGEMRAAAQARYLADEVEAAALQRDALAEAIVSAMATAHAVIERAGLAEPEGGEARQGADEGGEKAL